MTKAYHLAFLILVYFSFHTCNARYLDLLSHSYAINAQNSIKTNERTNLTRVFNLADEEKGTKSSEVGSERRFLRENKDEKRGTTKYVASQLSWKLPKKKKQEPNPGFNLDYAHAHPHPGIHNK